jgi:hypothetical protein
MAYHFEPLDPSRHDRAGFRWVVVTPGWFRSPPRPPRRSGSVFPPHSVPSALRSARRYPDLVATTASADSSHALAPEASPGKARELSSRAARLYQTRLSVTVGLRVS